MNRALNRFKEQCHHWHKNHTLHNYRGRANIYHRLTLRFGVDAVKRHQNLIRKVLDNAEGLCTLEK